ncbi:MAG: hypothetical protein ACR2N6_02120 [Miltoncostaeaceae bacterium]
MTKTYGPGDLVVTTEMEPAGDAPDGVDRLPAREAIYRTVAAKGPISIEDLASEFSGMAPGGARPPYSEDPATYVLRMVSGGSRELPGLATFDELVSILARDPQPDPDYGFEVRPA